MAVVTSQADVEVLGSCLGTIYDGFGAFKSSASRVLLQHHLGSVGPDKLAAVDPHAWLALEDFLSAFREIAREAGPNVMYKVGHSVPHNAVFPPQVHDVRTALQSIDVAYHLNHRFKGKVMFDPVTGGMLEGIGHYHYHCQRLSHAGHDAMLVIGDNPYDCDFDRGLITAMAQRFEHKAQVTHMDSGAGQCRKQGGSACHYSVVW